MDTIDDDALSCIMSEIPFLTMMLHVRQVCRRWASFTDGKEQLFSILRQLSYHFSAAHRSIMESTGLLHHTRIFLTPERRRMGWSMWSSLSHDDKEYWRNRFLCIYHTERHTSVKLTVFSVMQNLISSN